MAQKKAPLFKENDIELPAVKLFKAEEGFVVGKHSIGWMGNDFKKIIAGVVEHNIGKVVLATRQLARLATTKEIFKSIGKSGAISLAHLRGLLNSQTQSFLCIVLVQGEFWAVDASWDSSYRYWYVEACSVACQDTWRAGFQALSQVG